MEQTDAVVAIGRDPAALEAFYREHLPAVRMFVARRVDDPHTAADLTVDVFLAAIDAAGRYRHDQGTPAAWLTGIARNVVAGHLRRREREHRANARISGRALLDEAATERIAERLDSQHEARRVYHSLARLPAGQRAVVELVALDGLSLQDAAAVLGISATSARVRYHRGRTRIRTQLREVTS